MVNQLTRLYKQSFAQITCRSGESLHDIKHSYTESYTDNVYKASKTPLHSSYLEFIINSSQADSNLQTSISGNDSED